MPEGPEIRRAADKIARVLVDQRLTDVFFEFERLKRFEKKLRGSKVSAIDTRGKALLIRFGNGLTMYSHNQLYGRWYITRGSKTPSTKRSLRAALRTGEHSALLYSASDIDVLDKKGLVAHPFLNRVGPDILDPALTAAAIDDRLMTKAFRGRSLGALLLDQRFLAGTGNYLRSEILHFARLAHTARPQDLSARERLRLGRQIVVLARRSYRTRGVTNPPARVAALKQAGKKRHGEHRFAVFARQGRRCYECGTKIVRTDAGSRRLYYCPACQ